MKRLVKAPALLLALGAVALAGPRPLSADEIKYADLEKKITIDKGPVPADAASVSSYAPALAKVMPAVVTIFSSKAVELTRNPQQEELFRRMFPDIPEDFFDRQEKGDDRREEGLGSGVIISSDGYILTNNHVVGDADEIKVTLPSDKKKEFDAKVVGADPQTDVALIKIDANNLPHVILGDSAALKIGDVVLAVGNPLGLSQTATIGIISAVGRSDLNIIEQGYENFIQTDAAINRGNSGGALVDAAGRLIGIPTAIQSNFSGGNIGIGFAIPANMALNIVQRLLDGGGVVKRADRQVQPGAPVVGERPEGPHEDSLRGGRLRELREPAPRQQDGAVHVQAKGVELVVRVGIEQLVHKLNKIGIEGGRLLLGLSVGGT